MIAEILEITRAEANKRQKVDALAPFLSLFDELLPTVPQIRDALCNLRLQALRPGTIGGTHDTGKHSSS